jgi:hypothetical protein
VLEAAVVGKEDADGLIKPPATGKIQRQKVRG